MIKRCYQCEAFARHEGPPNVITYWCDGFERQIGGPVDGNDQTYKDIEPLYPKCFALSYELMDRLIAERDNYKALCDNHGISSVTIGPG